MAKVYLGLGSNLGDRKRMILEAVETLPRYGVNIERLSSVIETEPVGGAPQGRYLNAVVEARTELDPWDLLKRLKDIERQIGRVPTERFGPRLIDIDILLYDQYRIHSPELIVPHPRMWERDFVMMPLRELAGELCPDRFVIDYHRAA